MNMDLPPFQQFSDEMDAEKMLMASYLLKRAVANGGPSIKQYMIMLSAFSRGIHFLKCMLEEEGMTKRDLDAAIEVIAQVDEHAREDYEKFKQERDRGKTI